ncbi:MAG TPA: N-acetylmuramoyl-L-alanine amidase [Blastocatellia bacterium]|nr:N-acetylmuramoyl-L-alanine amidase [Blastocatellia bacterium]
MDSINGSGVRINNDPAATKGNDSDTTPIYSRVVERYALFFDRPEARLRFIDNTLTKQADRKDRLQRRYGRFRFSERSRLYNVILEARCYSAILEEMRLMRSQLPKDRRHLPQRIEAPFSARLLFLMHQTRHAFYGAMAVGAVMMGLVIYSFGMWSARAVNKSLKNIYGQDVAASTAVPSPTPNPANELFTRPESIFLVKNEGGYEKWSNGCAILTKYETNNRPRAYYTIPRMGETDGEQRSDKIVGIVYHTPENPMVEFVPNNNKAIEQSSRGLLEFVQKHKLYNYVINRIGEIYRIVRDDQTAYHAGDSLWADDKNTYVLLNESFLAVCFESKFEGASSLKDILTPAQLISGRQLTDVLRAKYKIDDANCTTHGLVAVDPAKMLIARHHDWVRFFPFEQMGLSDKYKIQPPTMTDYGCGVDDDVMAKLGNQLWEGAQTAGEEFNNRAQRAGISPDELRRKMQDRYFSQRNKIFGLHPDSGDSNNSLAKKPSGAGSTNESGAGRSTIDAWKAID